MSTDRRVGRHHGLEKLTHLRHHEIGLLVARPVVEAILAREATRGSRRLHLREPLAQSLALEEPLVDAAGVAPLPVLRPIGFGRRGCVRLTGFGQRRRFARCRTRRRRQQEVVAAAYEAGVSRLCFRTSLLGG